MAKFTIGVSYVTTKTYFATVEVEAFDEEAAVAFAQDEFRACALSFTEDTEADEETISGPEYDVLMWEE